MKITICAGKGGVGKTHTAVALASHYMHDLGKTVAVIDYDAGHSVLRTFGVTYCIPKPNKRTLFYSHTLLSVYVIDTTEWVPIHTMQKQKKSIETYLAQFPGLLGLIPFADMLYSFFGVLTDVEGDEKFAHLCMALLECERNCVDEVIIDVEPTAGLERLLEGAEARARSLQNLASQGVIMLQLIRAKWPDIGAFLKGAFMRDIEAHTETITRVARMLQDAQYILVTRPEQGPAEQALQVREIIHGYGGQIAGVVVNDVRSEPHEPAVYEYIEKNFPTIPCAYIKHDQKLHTDLSLSKRAKLLAQIGMKVARLSDYVPC